MCMRADFPEIRKSQSALHQTVSQSDRWVGAMMSGLSLVSQVLVLKSIKQSKSIILISMADRSYEVIHAVNARRCFRRNTLGSSM